jgi:tryptophan-rich sensory protein
MEENTRVKKFSFLLLLGFIFLCQAAGILGALFTTPAIPTWYAGLIKPTFSPPNWLFGPAWTLLYTLMGISLYLVYQKGLKDKFVKNSFVLFLFHLVINSLWSIIFFGAKQTGLAFIVIVLMWGLIATLIHRFRKINMVAAWLLIPYLGWVSFASVLNFAVWWLNR